MGSNNKLVKSKANAVSVAWANLAKDDSFAGMSLQQFTQTVATVDAQTSTLADLKAQYIGAAKQNDSLHEGLNAATQAVVNAVKADLTKHGPNSGLYKAMGYVPTSERVRGKHKVVPLTNTGTNGGTAGNTATRTVGPNEIGYLAVETGTEYTPAPAAPK